MSGVRIGLMRVDAFRGISSETVFDFSSPITVIFAPNGTGKTTMCEAAEWLLTGQVDRLRIKGHFDQGVLRSKFATDGREPVVDASILLDGNVHRLQRVVAGAENQARIAPGSMLGSIVRPNELLARLAPAAAAPDTHPLRAISLRQGWLRGTRFLSAEALSTLVDSDDGTIDRRKEVFADLLGIRHLLEAEKLADRYSAELSGHERGLAQTTGDREAEIARLTAELDHAPAGGATSAANEVAAAERRLALTSPAELNASLAARIEGLDVEMHRRRHVLETRRRAIEESAAQWSVRTELIQRLDVLGKAEPGLAKEVARIAQAGQQVGRALAAATARSEALKEKRAPLQASRASLVSLCSEFLEELSTLAPSDRLTDGATLATALERLPHARRSLRSLAILRRDIHQALEAERAAGDMNRRRQLLLAQLDASPTQRSLEEGLVNLQTQVDSLEADTARARQQLEATTDPLQRLQSAGRELLDHQHEANIDSCPLCSHDWGTPDALYRAIAATLAVVPEIEQITQQAAAASSEALRVAKARLEDGRRQAAQVARLRGQLDQLDRDAATRLSRLKGFGIEGDEPEIALLELDRRVAAAAALAALIQERDRVSEDLSLSPADLLPDSTPIARLEAEVERAVRERDAQLEAQLRASRDLLADLGSARDELRREHAVASESLQANREESARHHPLLERLRQLWVSAAPDTKWTDQGLASVRQWASAEQVLLEAVAAQVAAAKAAWTAELRRDRLEKLVRELGPLRNRLAYIRKRLEAARQASTGFHEGYVQVSSRQIEDLGLVVNALFARMHANRVFDRIKLGQVDDPLRWLADAGTQEMDPGKDFSQGQRQDLALALFLARARSLGGTFFLDEPVTHLDDLNRVGLLDILRATVMESNSTLNLVITTASKPLARHLIEKFGRVEPVDTPGGRVRPLRVIELDGNGRTGVSLRQIYPAKG